MCGSENLKMGYNIATAGRAIATPGFSVIGAAGCNLHCAEHSSADGLAQYQFRVEKA